MAVTRSGPFEAHVLGEATRQGLGYEIMDPSPRLRRWRRRKERPHGDADDLGLITFMVYLDDLYESRAYVEPDGAALTSKQGHGAVGPTNGRSARGTYFY